MLEIKNYKLIKRCSSKIISSFLLLFLLCSFFTAINAQERIGGWGDLFFGMNKKDSEQYLNKICLHVREESKENIIGDDCRISQYPFNEFSVKMSLEFTSAFLDRNRRLETIEFILKEKNKNSLQHLYTYVSSKWSIKDEWKCGKKLSYSSLKFSSSKCGATFSDNYIILKSLNMHLEKTDKTVKTIYLTFQSTPFPISLYP